MYDLIEWAGTQPWSNGKVGMSGVSYLAISQWRAAADASAAPRRDQPLGGGQRPLPGDGLPRRHPRGLLRPDVAHPARGLVARARRGHRGHVRRPPAVRRVLAEQDAGSRGGGGAGIRRRQLVRPGPAHARHARGLPAHRLQGQVAAGARAARNGSSGTGPTTSTLLRQFFDRFLLDKPGTMDGWPKVRMEVRERFYVGEYRDEEAWPLPQTETARAVPRRVRGPAARRSRRRQEAEVRYDATSGGAEFDHRFAHDHRPHRPDGAAAVGGGGGRRRHGPLRRGPEARRGTARSCPSRSSTRRRTAPSRWAGCASPTARSTRRGRHRCAPWHPHDREEPLRPGEVVPGRHRDLAVGHAVRRRRGAAPGHPGPRRLRIPARHREDGPLEDAQRRALTSSTPAAGTTRTCSSP